MNTQPSYRKPAFIQRPWIRGALYDLLSRNTILHMDASVFEATHYGFKVLQIECREGGGPVVSYDMWRIDEDGLTPLDPYNEKIKWFKLPIYWTADNHAWMARVHQTVLAQSEAMLKHGNGRWARVSVLCHYVHARETDCEIPAGRNHYVAPKAYKPRAGKRKDVLPDWL